MSLAELFFAKCARRVRLPRRRVTRRRHGRALMEPLESRILLSGSPLEPELTQDASSVIDFSSQFSADAWSAAQALGAPNTSSYGDISSAWAPSSKNGSQESITVGF